MSRETSENTGDPQGREIHESAEEKILLCLSYVGHERTDYFMKVQLVMDTFSRDDLTPEFITEFLILLARRLGVFRAKQNIDPLLKDVMNGEAFRINETRRFFYATCSEHRRAGAFADAERKANIEGEKAFQEEKQRLQEKSATKLYGLFRNARTAISQLITRAKNRQ